MSRSIERYGKTVNEAITEALAELKTSEDKVSVEVLEEGAKGFLGLGTKPCKVKVTLKYDPLSVADEFLREVFVGVGISAKHEIILKERQMTVNITGDGLNKLIGKHGSTLESLQYLLSLVVNKGEAPFINITIDCEDYRTRRRETLEHLAHNLARKAKISRRDVVLEPMPNQERRIIHAALQHDKSISTYSEGEEPYRYVVITPKLRSSSNKWKTNSISNRM